MWKVVTNFNLNPPLKLFFYSPILTNNNLLLKIYCENIVVTFLNQDFLLFILFLISLISFHSYVSFLFSCFSPPHTLSYLYPPLLLFFFSPPFKNILAALILSLSLSLSLSYFFIFYFYFLLDSKTFIPNAIQMGHLPPKIVGPAQSRCSSSSLTQSRWVKWLLSSVFFFFFLFFLFFLLL